MGERVAKQPPWSVALKALKDWLLRRSVVFDGCFATSSVHAWSLMVALQPPRCVVFSALKDWLLRNLL
jgi:poly(A) polymerase Pap1